MYLHQRGVYGLSGHITMLRGQESSCCSRGETEGSFQSRRENDEVAVMQSHLLWILMEIRCMREFQPSDVGFGLPHNKNLSTQVLLSPSRDSRTMRLILRWTRLLISSAAPPHPPLLRLMNISWSRSDSPPPALRSYSQTRTELSLPIAFR